MIIISIFIFIIEFAFFIAGIYAVIEAKMPSWIIGKGYKVEGKQVRLLGILMAAIMPGGFCCSSGLTSIGYGDPDSVSMSFRIVALIAGTIITILMIRKIRHPDRLHANQNPSRPEQG